MIQKQFVSLLLIASLSIISCGGNDKKEGDEKMTTTTDNKEATDKYFMGNGKWRHKISFCQYSN